MSLRELAFTLFLTLVLGYWYFSSTPFADSYQTFLTGGLTTLHILGAATLLSLLMAFTAGLARLSSNRGIRWVAITYVEVFRGSSALVQLFWLFYVLPLFGPRLDPFAAGVLGISLNIGAYAAVVVEASIRAVPRQQYEAATAINLTSWTRMRHIILPQAIRMMIPPFGNLFIQLFKLTALVSFIGVADLTYTAYQLNQTTYRTVEVFTIILFMYFAIGLCITILMKWLEQRYSRGFGQGRL